MVFFYNCINQALPRLFYSIRWDILCDLNRFLPIKIVQVSIALLINQRTVFGKLEPKAGAAVDHFHTVQCRDISNCSASSDIYLSKLCRLECYLMLFKQGTNRSKILSICIVTSTLSARACILIEYESFSEISAVLLFKEGCVQRIVCGTYIRREHTAAA